MYTVEKSFFGNYNIYRNGCYIGTVRDETDPELKNILDEPGLSSVQMEIVLMKCSKIEDESSDFEKSSSDTDAKGCVIFLIIIFFIYIFLPMCIYFFNSLFKSIFV